MSKFLNTLAIVLLTLICSLPVIAGPGGGWQAPSLIESEILHESLNYGVMLPESYSKDSMQHFPVLLVLDGSRYGDVVAGNSSYLARVGEIPEYIVIAIDSNNRMRDFTPTDSPDWNGGGGADNFLGFLRQELMPKIEDDYRASNSRVIWGHSLGGLFAMYTLYAAPDFFEARLVNDGTLNWDGNVTERLIGEFLEQQSATGQFLYFNSSYLLPSDDSELQYFDSLADLFNLKAPENIRWVYDPMPNETHASIPLVGSIKGLRALHDGFLVPEPVMFAGFDALMKHYEAILGRVGAPREVPEVVLNSFGYLMLGRDHSEAIRAFELATRLYPQSSNAWDSLSDGYLEAGKTKDAFAATEKSIEIAKLDGSSDLEYLKNKRLKLLSEL